MTHKKSKMYPILYQLRHEERLTYRQIGERFGKSPQWAAAILGPTGQIADIKPGVPKPQIEEAAAPTGG